MSLSKKLTKLEACSPALKWSKKFGRAQKKAYDECYRADWLLWCAFRVGVDKRILLKTLIELGIVHGLNKNEPWKCLSNAAFSKASVWTNDWHTHMMRFDQIPWEKRRGYWTAVRQFWARWTSQSPKEQANLSTILFRKRNYSTSAGILGQRSQRSMKAVKTFITWPVLRDAMRAA